MDDDLVAAAAVLRRLLDVAEAGDLAATDAELAYLAGAVAALGGLLPVPALR